MKKKPTGFIARCQCGKITGAMDYERTDRQEAGKILGIWLVEGNTIEPRFAGTWSETVERCTCDASPNTEISNGGTPAQ